MQDYYRYLDLERMYRVRSWRIDPKYDYVHLIRSFLQQAADRGGKSHAGATVHSKFDEPAAHMAERALHPHCSATHAMWRAAASAWAGRGMSGTELDIGSIPIQRWHRLASQLPAERTAQIRYEDLIAHTRDELERLCDFVGVDYDDQMLSYHETTGYGLPDVSLTEQWRKKLRPSELQIGSNRSAIPTCSVLDTSRSAHSSARPANFVDSVLYVDHRIRPRLAEYPHVWCTSVSAYGRLPGAYRIAPSSVEF